MEHWEQILKSFVNTKKPFPWDTYVNVSLAELDEAWRRRVLDLHYIDAWGIRVTMPKEDDRPGRRQYHLREEGGDLIGVVIFSLVRAEQTNFQVKTTDVNDDLVMLCVSYFVQSFLDERNQDELTEKHRAEYEQLFGGQRQIADKTSPKEPSDNNNKASTDERGRPSKKLYDEAANLLRGRSDGINPGESGYEAIYKWWWNNLSTGERPQEPRKAFLKAMKRRVVWGVR